MRIGLIAPAVVWLAAPVSLAVAQEGDRVTVPELIRFPFAPQTDTVFHYRITKTVTGDDKVPPRVLDQELTYHSIAGGYLLQIKTLSISVGGQEIRPQDVGHAPTPMPMPDIISLSTPITLVLGESGRTLAVSDWDRLREAIRLLPEQLSQRVPAAVQAHIREAANNAIQPIVQLNDHGAWTFVGAEWPPMLTFGGVAFPLNKTISVSGIHYLFEGAVPVKVVHEVTVTKTAGGGLTLDEEQRPDRVDFAAAVTQFYDGLAKSMSPQALAVRRANDASLKRELERSATTHIEVDDNGVLQSGFWEVDYERSDGTVALSERVAFEKLTDTLSPGKSN